LSSPNRDSSIAPASRAGGESITGVQAPAFKFAARHSSLRQPRQFARRNPMAVRVADSSEHSSLSVAERARRRITWRLMPFLLLLYFLAYIDRTNVGVTALDMKKSLGAGGLGFDDDIIGTGAGIFFIGYFLLEIPGTLIVERWSARKWIARIMISWGIIASMMGFIGTHWMNFSDNTTQFYVMRFTLGIAEAGFFPGIVVYLAHWFRYADRAKAKAFFMIGIPIATMLGVPLSRLIMEKVHWSGLEGWRWVFILEGLPSILLGFVTIFYLTDWPHQAKWLPEDEKKWLMDELERERREKLASGDDGIMQGLKTGLMNTKTILLAFIYLSIVTGFYGLTFFLPSIAKGMVPDSITKQTIIAAVPYAFGLAGMLLNSAHSDKSGERRWHTAWSMLFGSVALALSILSGDNVALAFAFLCLVGVGVHAYLPVFWTWPSRFMTASAAAAAVGLINSFGNLGGYVGPKIFGYLSLAYGTPHQVVVDGVTKTEIVPNYTPGKWFLVGCILLAGLLALLLKQTAKPMKG
jgi:ACS family tartrate transporter-like MFS transporter